MTIATAVNVDSLKLCNAKYCYYKLCMDKRPPSWFFSRIFLPNKAHTLLKI